MHVGTDMLGRAVTLVHVSRLEPLLHELPKRPFALFIAADDWSALAKSWAGIVTEVLKAGAKYLLLWGEGCVTAEDIADEAVVGEFGELAFGTVLTTSHPNETLCEAVAFAASAADHDDRERGGSLVVACVGDVHWYNEAHACLEDLLK